MKRFFIFLMCNSLLTMSSFAQFHKIGEAFVKDGVPCVVINVDESGQHGMAMSLVPKPKALKAAKKTGEHKWFYIRKKLTGKDKKLINEYRAEYYNRNKCESLKIRVSGVAAPTRTVTSLCGKENMKNVIDYCNEKGIAMEMYFPEYHWAQSLGDGWFIPGAEEMEMFIKIYGYEAFGIKHAQGISAHAKSTKSALNNYTSSLKELADSDDTSCFQDAFLPAFVAIQSSTMVNSGKTAESSFLLEMMQGLTGKSWYDMALSSKFKPYVCAVCEF